LLSHCKYFLSAADVRDSESSGGNGFFSRIVVARVIGTIKKKGVRHVTIRPRITTDVLIERGTRVVTAGTIWLAATILISGGYSHAQVAGSSTVGVTQEEMKWYCVVGVPKQIMGKAVYNEEKQKIGTIDDLIITPDKSVSYAIIGVGGFLGMGRHHVAIPVNHFKVDKDRITLPGATKDALKAMPKFEYTKK
jgi:sporulation protein YlmC with PRC-barrel domain